MLIRLSWPGWIWAWTKLATKVINYLAEPSSGQICLVPSRTYLGSILEWTEWGAWSGERHGNARERFEYTTVEDLKVVEVWIQPNFTDILTIWFDSKVRLNLKTCGFLVYNIISRVSDFPASLLIRKEWVGYVGFELYLNQLCKWAKCIWFGWHITFFRFPSTFIRGCS